ncbi:AI-2E family transporter [candidate division KSB1 bacterium]|nr:MAG: AI-2E family transporter [candidate division KSB1 bacterium]MBC6947333.1 AI-2E family transporter [candidate division KSB1 bacterium]MCE7941444.1 AI-2E family transporter [Chlorobi bacterium CHB1]MDL1874484.1 AI-2E family transporter [Cytophagia bacterium CHB2]
MAEQINSHRGTRYLVIAAALVIIIAGITQARSVVVLFLVSIFFAILGAPPVLWLERKRLPSLVAVLLVMAGMITILLIAGALVGASLNSFSNSLPFYQTRIQEQLLDFKTLLASKGIAVTDRIFLDYINPGSVMSLTAGLLAGLSAVLSNIVLILLTVTFILLEVSSFSAKLRVILGDPLALFPHYKRFVADIQRYMVMKTFISLSSGILIGIWLALLGVDFPVLWGFLAFLLNYVPNLGSIIAAVPAILLALIEFGIGRALLATAGYLAVNIILENMMEPRLMGRRLGLSTLVVFLSLIFWGSLLGLLGMVLSIPLTMILKLACESNESTRWLAVILGPEPSPESIPPASKKEIGTEPNFTEPNAPRSLPSSELVSDGPNVKG